MYRSYMEEGEMNWKDARCNIDLPDDMKLKATQIFAVACSHVDVIGGMMAGALFFVCACRRGILRPFPF